MSMAPRFVLCVVLFALATTLANAADPKPRDAMRGDAMRGQAR